MARIAVEGDFDFAGINDHQVLRWHAAGNEMGTGRDDLDLLEPGQLRAQLEREHIIEFVCSFAVQWWISHDFNL